MPKTTKPEGSPTFESALGELENIVAPDCILVSNTSSMSVTSIAAKLKTPQRFAGFHFFNPVPLMRLVEVISGLLTEEWVCEALVTIGKRMTTFALGGDGEVKTVEMQGLGTFSRRPEHADSANKAAAGKR